MPVYTQNTDGRPRRAPATVQRLAVLIAALVAALPVSGGLIARWTFDRLEHDRIPDQSGKFPAVLHNASGGAGIRRGGGRTFLSLPGTNPGDYVTLGSGPAFDLPQRFTLEVWFRPHPAPPRCYTMILGKRYDRQFQLTWTSSGGGTIEFYVGGGDLKKNRCWKSHLSAGRRRHVVAVFDAGAADGPNQWLYVDGRLARAVRNPARPAHDRSPVRIAQNSTLTLNNRVPADWFEAAVYNHAWTAREVALAYARKQPRAQRITGAAWTLPLPASGWRTPEPPGTAGRTTRDRMSGVVQRERSAARTAAALPVRAETGGLRFRLTGTPPAVAKTTWRLDFETPVDLSEFRYCLIEYRARGLQRAMTPLPVLRLVTQNNDAVLITSSHLVLDGRPHTCLHRIEASAPATGLAVELRTAGAGAELNLERVRFLRTPQPRLNAAGNGLPDNAALVALDLPAEPRRSFAEVFERALAGHGEAVHDPPLLKSATVEEAAAPVPFKAPADEGVLWPKETAGNERPVTAFGRRVPRNSFFPNARDDALEVPVGRSVSEVFLLLACDLPALEKRYSLPPVPWAITDVEAVDVDLVYADGGVESAFPWSIREQGYRILGPLGAYAVAADPARRLERIVLHNRMHGFSVGIAAVTVNPGRRRFPQLIDEPAPVHPPPPARVRPRPPVVRADAGIVTMDNGLIGMTLDCRNGFSIRELRNRPAPGTACRLDPTSGLEVRADGTVLTGRDFETDRVTVEASRVRIELTSRRADAPLVLLLTLEIGREPEVRMNLQARNAGAETLRADIRFPVLEDLVLDAPEHTWIFFPQYRNVLTNQPCSCLQPNHRGFPLQFMDVFQPERGGGVCLMTRNLEAEPVQYGLAKRTSGATAYIQNRGEDFPIPPGATVRLCERVLAVHGGDWHEAVRLYRAWLRTWYHPVSSQDKPWFRRAVWFRSHIASPVNAKNISRLPPVYDAAAHRWRTDEFLAADERLLGLKPDVFHFYVWAFDDSLRGDPARDGEYGPKDYAKLGGLASFRAAIRRIRRDLGLPVSLYTIWDRYNTDTEFAKKWGDRFAKMRADGQRLTSTKKIYISQGVPQWRDHAVRTLARLEADTEADVLYLDVFGSDDRGRDYNPNAGHAHVPTWVARDDADFLAAVRGGLPGRVALWGEFPVTDVGSRYWDGFLMYDCIPLHEYLARAEDVLETAPRWSRRTLSPNVLRFVLPHLRQVVFPVGTEGTIDNWRFLKFLLFNGQALFDTTWRLYDSRCRERLGRALRIQRRYMDCFDSDAPEMFVPTERAFVFANRFPGKGRTLWTLFNARYRTVSGAILTVPYVPGAVYRDLWNDRALTPTVRNGRALLSLTLPPQGIGCVLQTAPE